MKTILAALIIIIGLPVIAQTSVIRLKSHHGDGNELSSSEDKFGIPPPQRTIDTIERINETCVIHYVKEKNWVMDDEIRYRDTVCNHWRYTELQYDTEKIQNLYDNEITFIGFDKNGSSLDSNKNHFRKHKRSHMRWLIIPLLLLGLGSYIFQPQLAWKK